VASLLEALELELLELLELELLELEPLELDEALAEALAEALSEAEELDDAGVLPHPPNNPSIVTPVTTNKPIFFIKEPLFLNRKNTCGFTMKTKRKGHYTLKDETK
jgi:hypothetical protein